MAEIVAFLDGRISHFKYESSGVEQERIGHEHRANEGQVNEQIEDLGRENNQSPRVRGCFGWC
ncbi:unnamed protein product [Meloidogyne enterolobii]|uniref:Uncharacterized protein n=1 Tax=Meloidogyne enterolobii TaxID=390850 RepID=A0ACB1AWX7_MELEN